MSIAFSYFLKNLSFEVWYNHIFYDTSSIMKKPKNKFILWVICVILLIVWSQAYKAYSHNSIDTNSYMTLMKWEGVLNQLPLEIQKKYTLSTGDKIEILGDSSFWVVQWWDGSLTRLWWNTKIVVEQNNISRDYTKINISFDLIAGKTWSHVISFIGKDSSFTQRFEWIEAWVRGTVFDVDLTKEFIHVSDHQVSLTSQDGREIIVSDGEVLNYSSFSFIEISEFISSLEDSAWKRLNSELDTSYLWELKDSLESSLKTHSSYMLFVLDFISPKYRVIHELNTADTYETIEELLSKLSEIEKSSMYTSILSQYQSLNFITAKDYEFYKRKLFYKKALLELATSADKRPLLESTAHDVEDIVDSGTLDALWETLWVFSWYEDMIPEIDIKNILDDINILPEDLQWELKTSFRELENMFQATIAIDSQESLDAIDSWIQNFLEDNVGGLINALSE